LHEESLYQLCLYTLIKAYNLHNEKDVDQHLVLQELPSDYQKDLQKSITGLNGELRRTLSGSTHYIDKLKQIEQLILKGADCNTQTENGDTALHCIAKLCFPLINPHVEIDKEREQTVLDLVRFLFEHGADLIVKNVKGNTALIELARCHHFSTPFIVRLHKLKLAKLFLEQDGSIVNMQDKIGRTAMHYAVEHNEQIAYLLAQQGGDMDCKDSLGLTPFLVYATRLHHVMEEDKISFFIKYKVDLNAQDRWGNTALHHATNPYLLCRNGRTIAPVENSIPRLLKYGADKTIKNKKGETPVHTALDAGNKRAVRFLLEDVKKADDSNRSILERCTIS
jgi:ankyrin repeat protein